MAAPHSGHADHLVGLQMQWMHTLDASTAQGPPVAAGVSARTAQYCHTPFWSVVNDACSEYNALQKLQARRVQKLLIHSVHIW